MGRLVLEAKHLVSCEVGGAIVALCAMFTEDVFAYYGGKERFGDKVQVWTGRTFVVAVTVVAYLIAIELKDKAGIFELAIRFAFSGFAALAPIMLAALFWKRSTKWGALAATCPQTAACVPLLAAEAARQWTAQFNPRPLTADDFVALYWQVLTAEP